jgi:hypothetical protein
VYTKKNTHISDNIFRDIIVIAKAAAVKIGAAGNVPRRLNELKDGMRDPWGHPMESVRQLGDIVVLNTFILLVIRYTSRYQ